MARIRTMLLLVTPVCVTVCAGTGWLVLASLDKRQYGPELLAGGLANLFGGFLAVLPMVLMLNRGPEWLARTALAGTAIRMAGVLMGVLVAMGPGWHLNRNALLLFSAGIYMVMLVVETAAMAMALRQPGNAVGGVEPAVKPEQKENPEG